MKLTQCPRSVAALILAGAAALLAACTTPTPVSTYKTSFRLAIPKTTNAVTLDGLAGEAAWTNGFRFNMEDGSGLPAATLRGVADANAIYLFAEVEDTNFNDADVLVIGLNPDNTTGNYRRIHVFPCKPAGVCDDNGSGQNATVEYWTGSNTGSGYTWTAVPAAAAGLLAKTATTNDGVKKVWSVEVKIPRGTPFNFVDTNFFGLFVDVARTDPTLGLFGEATQYTWPPNDFIGGVSENDILSMLESGTLAPSRWGNATLSGAFGNGVSISANDIRTNHPSDPGKIRINQSNIFSATAANYSSSGGTLVTANNVNATFKIANNGLPALGSFANVPVSGNPTLEVDIAPTAAHTYQTGSWALTPQQKIDYTNNPNQCIRVELNSSDPNTVFVNKTAMRNMQFVTTSSPFREKAALTAKGFEVPGNRVAFTLRERFINFDPRLRWTTEIGNATRNPSNERVYRAELAAGGEGQLDISVTPPEIRIPSEAVAIPAGTGGPRAPVKLAVRPDELLTFISSGTVFTGGEEVTAAGGKATDEKSGRPAGALIGSFDGFERSSFVIGTTATIKVPADAQTLHLKTHDTPAGYEKQRGEGFQLQVVRTPIEKWMLQANPDLGRKVSGADVFMVVGSNLPTWILRGERDTGRFVNIGGKAFRVFEPVGSFGYIVKRIN